MPDKNKRDDTATDERAENIRMIRESAGFAREAGRLERMRAARYGALGYAPEDWKQIVDLGLFGLRVPENRGGAGFGMGEFCALSQELGKGLLPETILHAAAIARLLPDNVLEGLVTGDQIILPALHERLDNPDFVGARSRDGKVTGTKRFIPYALSATAFLVSTIDGLVFVEQNANGLTLEADRLQDGGHFGTLILSDAPGAPVTGDIDDIANEIALALAAYMLGMAEQTFAITREYLLTREQFGQKIGAFQTLQHRMVDLYLQIALTQASIGKAAQQWDKSASADQRRIAISRAKARASDTVALVTRQAVQMHGAMGYTDECDVGLYLRKAMAMGNCFGSSRWHRKRYASLMDLPDNRIAV